MGWCRLVTVVLVLLWSTVVLAQQGDDPPAGADGGGAEEELPPITKMPELLAFVKAEYPVKAVEEKIEASVLLEIDIDDLGYVEGVRVIEPASPAGYGFDEAAVAAVSQFEFSPAETAEGPIPVTFTYRYNFVLEVEPEEKPVTEPQEGEEGQGEPEREPVVNFEGILLERGTRTPLPGLLVLVFQGEGEEAVGYEALSDKEGRFAFYDLTPGPWKVLIESDGYFPFRTVEEVSATEVIEATYYIERGDYGQFDVLVEGQRARKEVTRRTITVEELEKIPGTFGDPIKVVQNLPGVARPRYFSGQIIVRGSSASDTQVYVNSVQVPLIYHFGGLRSVIPAGMIEQINFQPGNFPVRYGRAIGGILDVDLKELAPERLGGYVDVNVFDAGVYLEAPVTDELSVAVAGRRSYIDGVLLFAIPDNAPVNVITAPQYYDYQVLTSWRPNNDHQLKLFFFGSNDLLKVLFDNPSAIDASIQSGTLTAGTFFTRTLLEHDWVPNASIKNRAQVSIGNDEIDASLGEQFFFKVEVLQFQFRDEAEIVLNPTMTLEAGLDLQLAWGDFNIRAPQPFKEGDIRGDRDINDTITTNESIFGGSSAVFAHVELKGPDELLIIPGVRMEYFLISDAVIFDPRITARYTLSDQWTLKGGVGLFHQEGTPDEYSQDFGNPDLSAEKAVHYALGAEWRPWEHVLIDTTFFYKDMQELISRSPDTVVRNGETVPEIYNNGGEGRVFGVEWLVRHELTNNFFGWISYTLMRAERRDFGETEYRPFDFDQTHIFTAVGSYVLPRNWQIGLRLRYATGNPIAPVIGSVFNSDNDEYERVFSPTKSSRLPGFFMADLRIDKSWIYERWILTAYIDIQNATNETNVEGFQYNFDFSQFQPQQSLPVIPSLGIKAVF